MSESAENTEKVLENELKINEALEAQNKLREQTISNLEKNKIGLQEQQKLVETALKVETDKNKIKDLEIEKLSIAAKMKEDEYKQQLLILQNAEEELKLAEERNALHGEDNGLLDKAQKKRDDALTKAKQLNGQLEKSNEELAKATKQSEGFAEKLQKAGQNVGNFIGGIKSIAGQAAKSINDMSEATTGFRSASTILLDFESIKNTLKESVLEARNSVTSVANATGVAMGSQMRILSQGLGGFGIMNKELAESFNSLFVNMNKFSGLSVEMQAQLTATAAKMKNVGVDTKTYAQNLQTLNTSLGMSAKESNKVLQNIVQSARQAGIAPQVAMADFSAGMKKFVVYGKEGIDVFMQMEKQSKALGIEMSKLNQITGDAFDTFEGAAQKAGGLNAILGGDFLNATEMVNATETERIQLLRQAVEASGKSFESMDKYEKKAIAAQLGISDMEEAEKFFKGTSTELNEEMSKKIDNVSSLEKAQRSGADASRVQAAAERGLAESQRKLFENTAKTTNKMAEFIEKHKEWFGMISSVTGIIGPYANIFMTITSGLVVLTKMFTAGGAAAARGGASIGRGMVAMARGFKAFTGPQIIVGLILVVAAIVAIGYAIKIASEGLAKMVEAFKGLTGEQAYAAMGAVVAVMAGFVGIIVALGYIGIGAAPGILAVAAALMVMAGSVYYLNENMGPLKPELKELSIRLIEFGEKTIPKVLEFLINLAKVIKEVFIEALYAVGNIIKNIVSTVFDKIIQLASLDSVTSKLLGIAAGLTAIGFALVFLGAGSAIGAVGNLIGAGLQGITNFFTGKETKSGIDGVIDSIMRLGAAMNSLPSDTQLKVTGMTELFTIIQRPESQKFEASTKLLERGKEYYQAQASSKDSDKDALINALKIIFGTDNKDNTSSSKENPLAIKLYIDGDEMRNAVFKTSNI